MTIESRAARSNRELNVSTSDIVYLETKETEIYRDIFRFLYPRVRNWVLQDHSMEKIDKSFRVREVVNWLLDKHREFRDKYASSKENKSNRAHTITPLVVKRLERLIDLELLSKSDTKVKSLRNDTLSTDLYDVTSNGIMVTLTIGLQDPKNIVPHSGEDNKIIDFLLDEWLNRLPPGYRSMDNHYYYFIVEMMKNGIGKYRDIVLGFIDLFQEYYHGYHINFSDLRLNTNFILYSEMSIDSEFKTLFFKTLQDHYLSYLMGPDIQLDEPLARQYMNPKIELIKCQFKLDVENMIENLCSNHLKYEDSRVREHQWIVKNKIKHIASKDMFKEENREKIAQEIILDFKIKNQWEEERYKNLKESSKITALIKCSHCGQIYPMTIEIENDLLNHIVCKYCSNKGTIGLYDFENETNSQYRKRLLSRFSWMS